MHPALALLISSLIGLSCLGISLICRRPTLLFTPKRFVAETVRIQRGPVGLMAQIGWAFAGAVILFWTIIHAARLLIEALV